MPSFSDQRRAMVERYRRAGYITSRAMVEAMLKVPRDEFMDPAYREYAYYDQPFPIPGDGRQTISAPYMYPVTYEPLRLAPGMKVLEIGAGSGYGAALAQELVGDSGLVVAVEINPETFKFANDNLQRTGYCGVILVLGDGSLGYPEKAPFDAISVTASTPRVPQPLLKQLASPGQLVAPVGGAGVYGQDLLLVEKSPTGELSERSLMKVVYVPLLGEHGWRRR
ncbi:protein-L-isoaspartate O-methyltransferase [Candidatus Bathyarchaeota archaeon]|nr:protein-L-isoaspartate O-methyltransferase [Candidatus Bathyarchaeota archaeon]